MIGAHYFFCLIGDTTNWCIASKFLILPGSFFDISLECLHFHFTECFHDFSVICALASTVQKKANAVVVFVCF